MSLPAADELFRPTVPAEEPVVRAVPDVPEETGHTDEADEPPARKAPARKPASANSAPTKSASTKPASAKPSSARPAAKKSSSRRTSGRVRHDEKMTVYVTSEELLELEHARLQLRSVHGLAVDRGRIVREAVSLVLADLEAHGEDSALIRRLVEE